MPPSTKKNKKSKFDLLKAWKALQPTVYLKHSEILDVLVANLKTRQDVKSTVDNAIKESEYYL